MKYNTAIMKRLELLFVSLVALFAVACEQVAIETVQPEVKMVEVAFEATADDTRVALDGNTATWEVGDRISVGLVVNYYSMTFAEMEIRSANDISADSKIATFRGSIPVGEYYGITVLYPAVESNSSTVTLDRNAINNIYMSSYRSDNSNPVLKVTAGESAVVPITFSHLMHKMDFAITSEDNALNTSNIAIEISATSNGSPIEFVEKQTYNMRSNSASTSASATSIFAYGTSANFSTMLFPLNTTTNIKLTFGVYIDGEKRYEIEKGPFETLKMSAGKTTKVNLHLSADNGVTGGGEIVAEPITLSTTKSTIKANGVDVARLTVETESGEDVTAQSRIYVNGVTLNGTMFLTTSAGSYTLYAERNGMKSNELTITAEEVTSTGKTIVFAEGVTLTSGWYDVNKKANGDNGDINMCWAATSSNMIQWFQDRYKAAGKTLPAGAVDGPGVTTYTNYGPYELELMSMFHSEWDNSRGGHMQEAIPWYFEGKLNGGEFASPGSQAVPLTDGGYWKSIWDTEVFPYIYHGYENVIVPGVEGLDLKNLYITIFNNYYLWGNGTNYQGTERLAEFSKLVVESFKYGMAGLTVNLGANLNAVSHAVTLWGYEIDNATGLITRLWITDSDDLMSEPKTQLLNEYNVSVGDGNSNIKLTGDTRYGACYVVSLHPFAGYGSAE
ncbi:MAG: IdeS/Mac family cysteine endopeptidase [Alistipes sp.]|nr:IdeS/Mac family cysteine endopeptidase [Alistipes sp.]